ncbi:pimeloyl-ACP methyl ester carboxylesterase [Sphingomonas jejuensis]|uniref:Pimeloyl-ACP methyl ester carboxylesterase n=1 Tax=Sphingomonas jejuensis TaxID=904715 RepID=A0ABX0XNL4_9SPHN|nr:alpha/beta hydrolase [Sphingomonas jejuensis]NJC34834.1 pimeloyl-ACP methyl ester carboxylesterase [Sphingomonas jejuensis]
MHATDNIDRRRLIGTAAAAGVAVACGALLPDSAAAAPFSSNRMSVEVRGTGPDVILIHGLGGSRSVWDGLVAAVPGHRYHRVQINGFGGTAPGANADGPVAGPVAAEIARYIQVQRLVQPAVIGHSMGGIIGLMLATRVPAAVGRLMVVDILPAPATGYGFASGGSNGLFDRLREQFTATPGGRQMFGQLMSRFGMGATNPDVTANALHELATTDLGPQLSRLRSPLTVVYAAPPRDEADPRGLGRTYAAAYARAPDRRLVPVEGAGHMVMLDRPREFAVAVRGFLA